MPTLVFNDPAGSDTAASGSQGAIQGVSGTAASFVGSVVTLDVNHDLTGFDATADILWLETDSGRQFFDLASVDNAANPSTVTTVDAPAGTSTGLRYGIGNKRATFAGSRAIFADMKQQWFVETETDQTNDGAPFALTYAASANLTTNDGYPSIRGSVGSRKVISQTTNEAVFSITSTATSLIKFERLKLQNTQSVSKTLSNGVFYSVNNTFSNIKIHDCEFGDETHQLENGWLGDGSVNGRYGTIEVVDSHFHHCRGYGMWPQGGFVSVFRSYNSIYNNNGVTNSLGSGVAISVNTGGPQGALTGNIFSNNFSHGCWMGCGGSGATEGGTTFSYNNSVGNGGSGVFLNGIAANGVPIVYLVNNELSYNTAYGIGGTNANFKADIFLVRNNNFFTNGLGLIQDTDIAAANTDYTEVDPGYPDRANNDLRPGVNLRDATGFPNDFGKAGLTTSYMNIGGVQREEPAGGGGGMLVHPSMTGGIRG